MLCRFIFLRSMILLARKNVTFYRLRLRFEYYFGENKNKVLTTYSDV